MAQMMVSLRKWKKTKHNTAKEITPKIHVKSTAKNPIIVSCFCFPNA